MELIGFAVPVKFVDKRIVQDVCGLYEILIVLEDITSVVLDWAIVLRPSTILNSHFRVKDAVVVWVVSVFRRGSSSEATATA